jgi:adenine deaminase
MKITGHIIDPLHRRRFSGTVEFQDGIITAIHEHEVTEAQYILPGFIDAHIHIESSMLTPYEFSRMALPHGTVATVSDPHEIANVLGMEGIRYMTDNAKRSPLKFYFGAPSCVPATTFETSGATITANDIDELFRLDGLIYLAEMMNYPGVLHRDPLVMDKIAVAQKYGRKIDGHAPGLREDDAAHYIDAGISTDHECFTLQEAIDKLKHGMKVIIREGSAARNYEALIPLMDEHAANLMFCSDDKHPDDLELGHINRLVSRAVKDGYQLIDVLRAATVNPVKHYGLDVGLLQVGDSADFIVVSDLTEFNVLKTFINGNCVAEHGSSMLPKGKHPIINHFNCSPKQPVDFKIPAHGNMIHLIEALDGQLITLKVTEKGMIKNGFIESDPSRDQLKITVVNRYSDTTPAMGMIKNIGLKRGAIASTVAHDSHNIIAVGCSDEDICRAVNLLIQHQGGLCAIDGKEEVVLPLPIAGLISDEDGISVSHAYSTLDRKAKEMGTTLRAPYMTLSFMALLVIPEFKMSDLGLFDAVHFRFAKLSEAE